MRSSAVGGTPVNRKMSPEEYSERSSFVEEMKKMNKSEFVEIARLLRRFNVSISENRSGLFFDMREVPREAFDALLAFREYVTNNNAVLDKERV